MSLPANKTTLTRKRMRSPLIVGLNRGRAIARATARVEGIMHVNEDAVSDSIKLYRIKKASAERLKDEATKEPRVNSKIAKEESQKTNRASRENESTWRNIHPGKHERNALPR